VKILADVFLVAAICYGESKNSGFRGDRFGIAAVVAMECSQYRNASLRAGETPSSHWIEL